MTTEPFIRPEERVAEITCRGVLLALFLTVLLATSNAYLALKLGLLTSASIPAAIISMGILRLFKNPTILENNAVQTAASAGEAVAGGIVYTIPALIIIEYWHHFDYWTNFLIAFSGGVLGVLFSIPLRRLLVQDSSLKFPEGRAIAEVLKSAQHKLSAREILWGGLLGGALELFQVGFKFIANTWDFWFVAKRTLWGMSFGFSATMLGAGYLVGHEMAISIFIGAILSWSIGVPVMSHLYPALVLQHPPAEAAAALWNQDMRYLGIGAMLFAGLWTLLKLLKPLSTSIRHSLSVAKVRTFSATTLRTDKDIPVGVLAIGIIGMIAVLFFFCSWLFPLHIFGSNPVLSHSIVWGTVVYIVVVGFFFSVITAYFSGMVGVTASPGSSVVIAGIFFAAWLLLRLLNSFLPLPLDPAQLQLAEAIVIITSGMVTGIAAIANDNVQDLKVGQLVGATPWKQQLMLLFGVLVSSLVIPAVMQILFQVYGIAGVMPHEGMDMSQSLPAPTAAILAAITQAVFAHHLPWRMMLMGAGVILALLILLRVTRLNNRLRISILGIAVGMYLPMSSSFPLFIGGMFGWLMNRRIMNRAEDSVQKKNRLQVGTLIACGLVAGAALMEVFLAIPFSIWKNPNVLSVVGKSWMPYGVVLGFVSLFLTFQWIRYRMTHQTAP